MIPEDASAGTSAETATEALIRLTIEHDNVTLVCLGPLTNVALAMRLDPGFVLRPAQIVAMGGNYLGEMNRKFLNLRETSQGSEMSATGPRRSSTSMEILKQLR